MNNEINHKLDVGEREGREVPGTEGKFRERKGREEGRGGEWRWPMVDLSKNIQYYAVKTKNIIIFPQQFSVTRYLLQVSQNKSTSSLDQYISLYVQWDIPLKYSL